jgi:hypothetical protein
MLTGRVLSAELHECYSYDDALHAMQTLFNGYYPELRRGDYTDQQKNEFDEMFGIADSVLRGLFLANDDVERRLMVLRNWVIESLDFIFQGREYNRQMYGDTTVTHDKDGDATKLFSNVKCIPVRDINTTFIMKQKYESQPQSQSWVDFLTLNGFPRDQTISAMGLDNFCFDPIIYLRLMFTSNNTN